MSYPDLVEDGGRFYVTETQKNIGRVHEIPSALLDGLFHQWENRSVARTGLVLNLPGNQPMPIAAPMPRLPEFHTRDGRRPDYGGPKIITFVVDGVLGDGGEERQFGWGRFSPHLRVPNPDPAVGPDKKPKLRIAPAVASLRIYDRALRTSEAVGNWRAGMEQSSR